MGNSCSLTCHIKNKKGEVVESRLFNDLLHYTSNNRAIAKEYYGIATDTTFIEAVRDKAIFDENGEISFNSLRKFTDLREKIEDKTIIETLSKELGTGTFSYQDAVNKIQFFNRQSDFKDEFLATVKRVGKDQYKVSVVRSTPANRAKLNNEIKNRSLIDRIKYHLNKAGVGVSFIDEAPFDGRYSTENAEKAADGLYYLCTVAKNERPEREVTESLAEEAGHFAIAALGDSPLVTRALTLLTPEMRKKLFSSEELQNKNLGSNSSRELLGYLVGKKIAGNIDQRGALGSLISRFWNYAKNIFAKCTGNKLLKEKLEIEKAAEEIAKGFMSPDINGSLENALKENEVLYDAKESYAVSTFKQLLNHLRLQAYSMKTIDPTLYKQFDDIVKNVVAGREDLNAAGVFGDTIALQGMVVALNQIIDLMNEEIPKLLESVDFSDTLDFKANMVRNAKSLRVVRNFTKNALAISKLIGDTLPSLQGSQSLAGGVDNIQIMDIYGVMHSYNLKAVIGKLNEAITGENGMINALKNKEFGYFSKFCSEIYGKNYIERSARVLFNWRHRGKQKFIKFMSAEKKNIVDYLNYLEDDISLIDQLFASMSNNPDIIGQIVDKAAKAANKVADDITLKDWDRLKILKNKMEKAGINNTRLFCEKSMKTGGLTGNILTELCWGDWENNYKEKWEEEKKRFNEDHPEYAKLSDFIRGIYWQKHWESVYKEWHKQNSVYDNNLKRYIPNSSYKNPQYEELERKNPKAISLLKEFIELKKDIDSRLPEGSTTTVRLPQFKGTFTDRIGNSMLTTNVFKSTLKSFNRAICDNFVETSVDTEYGSDNTFNSIDEDPLDNAMEMEKEKINRLPLFGINKLPDPSIISTDLYHSFLAYASMANTHAAMGTIVDSVEVGREVLSRRKVAGMTAEEDREENKSRVYIRYVKFLEKQIYGKGQKRKYLGKVLVNKIAAVASRMASLLYLGGNVHGGAVNLGTGFIEIFKEGLAGEYFTLKNWRNAHAMYWGSFGSWTYNIGKDTKDDKVSLFIKKFNTRGTNKEEFRDWHTRRNRASRFLYEDSIFLPYKLGDHYMQTLPYLALADKIKVYNLHGEAVRLFDAYDKQDVTYEEIDDIGNIKEKEVKNKLGQKSKDLELNDIYLKDPKDIPEYNLLSDIIETLRDNPNQSPFDIYFTQEEVDYLVKKGYNNYDNYDTLLKVLTNDREKLTWNQKDESAFMDKAREINNRMHGIYNNQDKVAITSKITGNMFLAMKGYALGLFERRFGSSKYSIALGDETEGSMRSLLKFLYASSIKIEGQKNLLNWLKYIILPVFGKNVQRSMLRMGFSENQYRNIRRSWGDFVACTLLVLLRGMTAKDDDDDKKDPFAHLNPRVRAKLARISKYRKKKKEDDNIGKGIIHYFATRLFQEQGAYVLPGGVIDEAANLLNLALPVGITCWWTLADMTILAAETPFASEDNSNVYYKKNSALHKKGDLKLPYRVEKLTPYLKSKDVFTHPYEATKGFLWSRQKR